MLPRRLYESLPSAYLGGGSLLLLLGHPPLLWGAGALLFGCGALIWMMRSSYRRTDLVVYPRHRWLRPEWLYEAQPFLLLGLAIALGQLEQGGWLALLIAGWALRCLWARHRHRHHTPGLVLQLKRSTLRRRHRVL